MEDIGKVVPTKPIWPKRPEEEERRPPSERERDDTEGDGGDETQEQPQTPGEGRSDGHIDVFV